MVPSADSGEVLRFDLGQVTRVLFEIRFAIKLFPCQPIVGKYLKVLFINQTISRQTNITIGVVSCRLMTPIKPKQNKPN
jgi:hypothetical protein